MIDKTPTGVAFFDAEYGGAYRNRGLLVTGRAKSGKTMLGLQFLAQGLRIESRGLMLSTHRSQDLAITANAMGMPVTAAIDSGALTFLEYNEFVPGRDQDSSIMLPPDGFAQLKDIIETHAVQRVVIDSVLPWISLPPGSPHLAEHIFSLVRAFERLNVTAMFTLPKPVSAPAVRLRKMLEDILPVSVTLVCDADVSQREWVVSKYVGLTPGSEGVAYEIDDHKGIVASGAERTAPFPAGPRAPVAAAVSTAFGKAKTSFASLVLDRSAAEPFARGLPSSSAERRG